MTTLQTHTFTCPLCGEAFESNVVASTNSFGKLHSDMYREADGMQPICYFVHTCPACGYTGFEGDFQPQTFTEEFRAKVAKLITPEVKSKKIPANGHYYLAALCADWRDATPLEVGRIYHMGAWCFRMSDDPEKDDKELFYLIQAIDYFERAFRENEPAPENRGMFCYLIGDLHRRLEETDIARDWYEKAIDEVKQHNGDPGIEKFARRQLKDPADLF